MNSPFFPMSDRIVNYLFLCLFCCSLVLLTGCPKAGGGGPAGPGGPGAGSGTPPEVIVDNVSKDDVQIYIYTDGLTVPSNSVEIRARVSGYLEQLFFQPGAIVKEGDRLALIEQATYQVALDSAKAELANAKAQASLAEADLGRAKRLIVSGTITTGDLQAEQAKNDMALAAIDRANAAIRNAELNLQYTELQAPITGKTTKNLVDIGNFVSPTGAQAVLLAITQLDPMYVEFKLSDRQFIELKNRIGFREAFNRATDGLGASPSVSTTGQPLALMGMPVDVSLMTGMDVFKFDFDIPGKIVALVDDQIKFSTAQITFRAELRNPLLQTDNAEDYLIYPGQACQVRLPYEKVENAILIREEAILTDLDTKYVLAVERDMYQPKDSHGNPIKDKDGKEIQPYLTDVVVRKDIKKLGRLLDSQMRIVLEGLQPGETYIVKGVQRVRIGVEVKPTTLEAYNARLAAETEKSGISVEQEEQ